MSVIASNMNQLSNIFLVIFAATYASVVTFFIIRKMPLQRNGDSKEKLTESENDFLKVLGEGVMRGLVTSLDDIDKIYIGTIGLQDKNKNFRDHLSKLLHMKYSSLILGATSACIALKNKDLKGLSIEEENKIKTIFENAINENNKISPFSFLKDSEQILLTDMLAFSEAGDKESLSSKLGELSTLLHAKNETERRLEKINKWSVPLTIVGMVLTIVFGVMSIVDLKSSNNLIDRTENTSMQN